MKFAGAEAGGETEKTNQGMPPVRVWAALTSGCGGLDEYSAAV
jgi:hypothetical protein